MVFFALGLILSAHEEPAKTLKEKREKEQNRKKILAERIGSTTVFKHTINNGVVDTIKEVFMTTRFDQKGNIASMSVFKSSHSLDYEVVFTYDYNNNMLTDTDYNSSGQMVENIQYTYDMEGRVKQQLN